MHTLAVKNGDWDFSDRRGKMLTGSDKLVQSLGIWLTESLHVDRFHYQYGSLLQSYIGQNQSDEVQYAVEKEIRRVLNEFIKMQTEDFEKHPEDYSKDEVIVQVLMISSEWKGTPYNSVALSCHIWLKTMAGKTVQIDEEV